MYHQYYLYIIIDKIQMMTFIKAGSRPYFFKDF